MIHLYGIISSEKTRLRCGDVSNVHLFVICRKNQDDGEEATPHPIPALVEAAGFCVDSDGLHELCEALMPYNSLEVDEATLLCLVLFLRDLRRIGNISQHLALSAAH